MDMGYADSFRLWGMSAFDDREQMQGLLGDPTDIPESWRSWVSEQLYFD
jgi:hypothetical protein